MVVVGLDEKYRSEAVEGGSGYKGEWSVDLGVEGMVRGWGDKSSSNRWWWWGWLRPP